jgi:uncharacterized damage-inducible protein DinB
MNGNDAKNLFVYNRWANNLTLDAIASLSPEQFITEIQSSYRSIRDTLTHILSSEWVFLMRCLGESPKELLDPAIFPDLKSIRMKWDDVDRQWQKYITELSDESFEKNIGYTNFRGEHWEYPLSQILQHVVNHSTYHRGQITTQLRTLGANPVMTDYLYYWDIQNK